MSTQPLKSIRFKLLNMKRQLIYIFEYRNHTVLTRIAFLLIFLLLFATAISFVYSRYLVKSHNEALKEAQNFMLQGYERTLRSTGEVMARSLEEAVLEAAVQGLDPEERMRHIINNVRYEDHGYYFIYDTSGTNIAHPYFPEFKGHNRIAVEDPSGKQYIRQLAQKAVRGGGFVTYSFYKPGEHTPSLKLVYARMIPGTEYWLGTGLYIDDIEREKSRISASFKSIQHRAVLVVGSGVFLILVIVVIPISLVMISSILKPWRQLEKELQHAQKMEAIGIFAGGIAHDFSNVLGAITSCTELALYEVPRDALIHEDLRHILKAANRGKSLIQRIKKFSSQADTSRHHVNMNRVVKECMHLVTSVLPATIDVRTYFTARNVQVRADSDQLLQVIMNLCTNAEQAMRGRQGLLTVCLDVMELDEDEARSKAIQPGTYAHLTVRDNGTGMKPVVLKHIFEPFYTTRKKTGGTGLGLSMTRSIIKMHGGTITVTSTPNQGSAFAILLPCVDFAEEKERHDKLEEFPRGSESLLIVDDDGDILASLHKLFTRLGYNVISFRDSPTALELFQDDPDRFDLVLTDQLMAGMTGTELTREIHRSGPEIPVILCSGFEGSGLVQRIPKDLNKIGISAFFGKPFDTMELCKAVRHILDTHQPSTR
ncbi:MAG TPA: cache domain-containing protein [Desulfomicrobiaceae bacterium]|nr:cache domain-containing protein [Desulfomicrobiaceae bacterium]